MKLTAPEKIQQLILKIATGKVYAASEEIEQGWSDAVEEDLLHDAENEVRNSGIPTKLKGPSSYHFEAKEVAIKVLDGSMVGFTYWYGGGKHGGGDEVEWIDFAYDVEMREEMQLVKVFTRVGESK